MEYLVWFLGLIKRQSTTEEILISRGFRRESTTEELIKGRNFCRTQVKNVSCIRHAQG